MEDERLELLSRLDPSGRPSWEARVAAAAGRARELRAGRADEATEALARSTPYWLATACAVTLLWLASLPREPMAPFEPALELVLRGEGIDPGRLIVAFERRDGDAP